MKSAIKVGIVGGTGYTGVELLRLLAKHPETDVTLITSRKESGVNVSDIYPNLRGHVDLAFSPPDSKSYLNCDVIFFATPNGIAMQQVPELIEGGVRVIDLSADFRLKNVDIWEHWYGQRHASPDLIDQAVYGLPEMNRKRIQAARLIANPGCYPTAVQLGLYPLIKSGWIDLSRIIADAKSGASGAGKQASVANLLSESYDNFKAYAASGHRHLPEIQQGLSAMSGNQNIGLTFVPHLLPIIRGIEATIYVEMIQKKKNLEFIHDTYFEFYRNEPFVDVLPLGTHAETRSVKSSNTCRISLHQQPDNPVVIISSVIDNLVKGAAGQAIQNMNIMFGFPEVMGLEQIALLP